MKPNKTRRQGTFGTKNKIDRPVKIKGRVLVKKQSTERYLPLCRNVAPVLIYKIILEKVYATPI